MNDSETLVEINVRAPRYFIARTRRVCRHCNEPTDLFALALSPGHETLDIDEAAEGEGAAAAWIFADDPALIFHVVFLNPQAVSRLAALTNLFRVDQQGSSSEPAWTNHCEACGSSLDDEELFCEPGEAFFPTSETGAAAIRLVLIEESIETTAGGYSFDPNFFYAMTVE